ncbi:MAG: nucleoside-triphosphatase [Candidatus Neomarinimicrobiota bacterium]
MTVLLLLVAFTYRGALRPLTSYKFWIPISLLIVVFPVFTGYQDRTIVGISYSSAVLNKTILMALRGITIYLLFQVLTTELQGDTLRKWLSRFRIAHLGEAFHMAQGILPRLKRIAKERYDTLQSAGPKKHTPAAYINAVGTFLADLILMAEQMGLDTDEMTEPSPNSFIQEIRGKQPPLLIILVGIQSTGKTTWLSELATTLKEAGGKVDGLLAPKEFESKGHWHHVLERISTGERRSLNTMKKIETPIKFGRFFFRPETISWGCEQLASARHTDWLIIDEIGPLEFQGEGLLPALRDLLQTFTGFLVVSMRSDVYQRLEQLISDQVPFLHTWPQHIVRLPVRNDK